MNRKTRAIFLDRDGVICENRADYVKSWQEFEFLPGAKESLAILSRLGLPIVVVTNQAVIGRKMAPVEAVEDIHRRMAAEISAAGGRIDRILYCPHCPGEGCACRKPEPGMLLQAAADLNIDLAHSYMVGDAAGDVLAGQRVGCRALLVLSGRGWQQLMPALQLTVEEFTVTRNLMTATSQILKFETEIIGRTNALAAKTIGGVGKV